VAAEPGAGEFGRGRALAEGLVPLVRPGADLGVEALVADRLGDARGGQEALAVQQRGAVAVEVDARPAGMSLRISASAAEAAEAIRKTPCSFSARPYSM
jgi:hypothetical protein